MTREHALGLVSAVFGALGTISLFKGSFAFEQPMALSNKLDRQERHIRNVRCLVFQRIGLGFLLLSFVLQAVAVSLS
jgi:hypothetical protein